MKFHELQTVVAVEAMCLILLIVIAIATFKRWHRTLIASTCLTAVAFFSTWSNIMALGATLVYGSASVLLWWQLEEKISKDKKGLHRIAWGILATGVAVLILNNLNNIFIYLGHQTT